MLVGCPCGTGVGSCAEPVVQAGHVPGLLRAHLGPGLLGGLRGPGAPQRHAGCLGGVLRLGKSPKESREGRGESGGDGRGEKTCLAEGSSMFSSEVIRAWTRCTRWGAALVGARRWFRRTMSWWASMARRLTKWNPVLARRICGVESNRELRIRSTRIHFKSTLGLPTFGKHPN